MSMPTFTAGKVRSTFWIIGALVFLCSAVNAETVYKYKDASGKWVFTDKKPEEKTKTETLTLKNEKKKQLEPSYRYTEQDGKYTLWLSNPFFSPMQVEVSSLDARFEKVTVVLAVNEERQIVSHLTEPAKFEYRWILGDPSAQADAQAYRFPVVSLMDFEITQAFGGAFSHHSPGNQHAVDIAMQVGTDIGAARDGVVILVKDDYHMGGAKNYFLDKANVIYVLHSDGTIGTYAHILQGTAVVKPGDKVKAGDKLARSGSSGYSTGPHLHFVIRRNVGMASESVPFRFIDSQGVLFVPQENMIVAGDTGFRR